MKKKWGEPPLTLRDVKNSYEPIIMPTVYTYKISSSQLGCYRGV